MVTRPIAEKAWLPDDSRAVIADLEGPLMAGSFDDIDARVMDLIDSHERHMDVETIGLNAGTNVMNPRAAALLGRSLGNRPSLGFPGDKYEMGMQHAEKLEITCESLVKKLFEAPFAEIRVPSGAIANLYTFMATCKAGDAIMAFPGEMGGHVTHHSAGCAGLYGLDIHPVPYDAARMTIDLERLAKEARRIKPKLITLAGSLCLFPYPVAEVRAIADEVGAYVLYDAAHMGGMIAGKRFQDPLREGAHLMTMSTYKAFGGPPSGLLVSADEELARRIDAIAFPGMTANFDLGKTAALLMSVLDLLEYGETYADTCLSNAKSLAKALEAEGFAVHGVDGQGHTQSHHLALHAAPLGGGQAASKRLAEANILLCGIGLPIDPVEGDLNGIRIGTQEITRQGMGANAMAEIARLMARLWLHGERAEAVRKDVIDFRRGYQELVFVR
ncbi:MAG: aminotransferase class I/II-fold pyridoxal phosphate-dependent enzyme [Rhodospirillaceae bacterium]|jgi:glycine hydroxymethyltransferase|nr:aminotransferase class I/II-fold pyridoxal phosphate-dependent enzyme [Rhodospirillaceae bacterium]MBT5243277.1 aminotransferase class I/II-fold pyridoxal phosphate-dependent enzyme [Rhodospirillaceae bacterium]MBT5563938.1 aminotransferase class I/II-fold pyridoxal phosphate-dependent enzyme [Rhodospirillaceae bacterium]MBT6240857.1 aminotransferase class I/II-fold pyridoxal phosphate-dependent enzyme [Rhodospirillaceae bacterium]MBT7137324.1 aminotransferase class I/II-fold pyridoxal phosp